MKVARAKGGVCTTERRRRMEEENFGLMRRWFGLMINRFCKALRGWCKAAKKTFFWLELTA
jgi:hypothetical protein